ncbi:hypothetical protein [Saccharothrix coeruleofusca]|uniref:Uncharacterized protein n=1 Tax=Saccharothrix coeruleofusca TaxID=33919 RepID=A0A918AUL2_9PSEU|nr:hypothetical protein [Saccharothrix coeruleofusca]GGP73117.1 hypothetical protein GCM10010185_53220 [Saccharothrix coeruleofusca]
MPRRFTSYLDAQLADATVSGLLSATLGILGFGSVLSAAFGSTAVKAAGLVIGVLHVVVLLAVALGTQRALRRDNSWLRELLTHYTNMIYSDSDPLWRVDRWVEHVHVQDNGDATVSITVCALAEADELHFFRVRLGSFWKQSWQSRRKVDIEVSAVDEDDQDGPRWKHTDNWLPDGRLEVLVHFQDSLPKKGDAVRLKLHLEWPGKVAPLMRGEPDEFVVRFGQPLAHLEYRVSLPACTRVRHWPIGCRKADDFALKLSTEGKRTVIALTAEDIDADRRVGMRLDLR